MSHSLASSLDEFDRAKLSSQLTADRENIQYTPNLEKGNVFEETLIGRILLGRHMFSGDTTSIFHIRMRPDLFIKYQVQCSNNDTQVHPALREAWYMSEASRFGLSPAIISVSPPAAVCEEQEGKCMFKMTRSDFASCEGGIVRYTIMKKISGYSVWEYRRMHALSNGAMSLTSAVTLGAAIVRALERLHLQAGVVHGDINAHNILLQENGENGNQSISFVDFKMASKYSRSLPDQPVLRRGTWKSAVNSPWQIEGYAGAARDDLYRTIHLVANLINTRRYHEIEQMLQRKNLEELLAWKQQGNLFRIDNYDPVEALGDDVGADAKLRIRQSLKQILGLVRNVEINDVLPYSEVIRLFELCQDLSNSTKIQDKNVAPLTPI